jgi:hypothetical protein
MEFSQQELEVFWNYYVKMTQIEVLSLTCKESAAYDPIFDAKLSYVYKNRLFGFENYTAANRDNRYFGITGGASITNGPTKS